MKLTQEQAEIVKDQLDLQKISESDRIQEQLENAFGPHTFFLGDKGLFVFQEEPKAANGAANRARLFVVAAWSSEEKKALAPIEPAAEADILLDLQDGSITGGE